MQSEGMWAESWGVCARQLDPAFVCIIMYLLFNFPLQHEFLMFCNTFLLFLNPENITNLFLFRDVSVILFFETCWRIFNLENYKFRCFTFIKESLFDLCCLPPAVSDIPKQLSSNNDNKIVYMSQWFDLVPSFQ